MDNTLTLVVIIAVGLLLLGAGLLLGRTLARWQHSRRLQKQFGPEYERLVHEFNNQDKAEAELDARQERVASLNIHPLPPEETKRFGEQWRLIQANFVDQPAAALGEAHRLVTQVMQARGYP